MSFFRSGEPRPATDKIENVVGPSADFSGHLKTKGGVRIDGNLDGSVESESNVIVGENARVIADISAFNITVAGVVEGKVTAVGRLEILSTGRVEGDVKVGSLLIEEGGMFHGQSLMDEEETSPAETEVRPGSAAAKSKQKQGQRKGRSQAKIEPETGGSDEET